MMQKRVSEQDKKNVHAHTKKGNRKRITLAPEHEGNLKGDKRTTKILFPMQKKKTNQSP